MNKCVKINLIVKIKEGLLQNLIQKNAKKFNLEGIAQVIDPQTVRIIACGSNEDLDNFIDALYDGYKDTKPSNVEVEPFIKDRDYRGVFRIIE